MGLSSGLESMQQQPTTNHGGFMDCDLPVFGSLLVDEKSLTPYSDATQVVHTFDILHFNVARLKMC